MTISKKLAKPNTKIGTLIKLVSRQRGATLEELQTATGWQAHSVRSAISATLNKKRGLCVARYQAGKRGWVYRLPLTVEAGEDK